MAIHGLTNALPSIALSTTTAPTAPGGFGDTLRDLLNNVEDKTGEANVAISNMLDGTGDVHEAMIAMQKADTMLQLTVQVRNKLVQAYQDVMRMPV
jgi:flagellar hook-basal body complex protein FliE